MEEKKTGLPTLASTTIWMISLGYLGVQIAFTLETSQMSRIFQTLGADPTKLACRGGIGRIPNILCNSTSSVS